MSKKLRSAVKEKTLKYVMAGFGLVAGLAWNDAIKGTIKELFPLGRDSILAKFIYALIVTLVLVLVSVYLVKFLGEKKKG
jgi:hypothetical protein